MTAVAVSPPPLNAGIRTDLISTPALRSGMPMEYAVSGAGQRDAQGPGFFARPPPGPFPS
jgi:hypothetical protein